VVSGELSSGKNVTLKRDPSSYPAYFLRLLTPEDSVVVQDFPDEMAQAAWVAAQIRSNLDNDELDVDDILIVLPDAITAKKRAALFVQALFAQGLRGHLAGVTSSQDASVDTQNRPVIDTSKAAR